jgi:hypothetical protein
MNDPKPHGGARPRAGRPKLNKVTVVLRLETETARKLAEVAEREALSQSGVAEWILSKGLRKS